jgi:maltose alpha-D-glucosyltransferase/alpha-amylase
MAKQAQSIRAETDGEPGLAVDPQWYKDAVIYQLHVRSYFDSDNDGIGDFAGLTKKLDYLQDLGVTALWLLPFYPSPLRDDGYDIASYTAVHPAYGHLRDFKAFVRAAHARGLRVITELVLNHTSDQHPWFQRARKAKPGSPARDFYVWSDTPEKYSDARIIFKDFEVSNWAWDPLAKAYYWHRFYAHQPDLNFDNPRVRQAMFDALDYWLRLGVDGLRLDAVPYLYEREGTNCENLPETHAFLKQVRKHIDELFPGRMLLAEANQWPEDAIAYFGDGDECQAAFHFPVMPRLFMAIHMEDRYPIVDILQQTPPIPPDCQWFVFLRNHDELTLEMVTDEERDYMYRVYARDQQARINLGIRRRLAPLLANNRRRIELMNALLFSLPGTPVIYYGDEIGMGDNIYLGDRHGVRTPMQWSPDRNAGFSGANPQRLYSPVIVDPEYLFETVNVENQQKNPHSLLWWMKRLIALRQQYIALSRGSIELLAPENPKILAFTRDHQDQSVLVVANLSRFTQFVELDLSRFAGRQPVEMFGQTAFPRIGPAPYVLSLSPHGFFWFALARESGEAATPIAPEPARLTIPPGPQELVRGRVRRSFEAILLRELPKRRWFGPQGRVVQSVHIVDSIPLGKAAARGVPRLLLLRVEFIEGESENCLLPLGTAWGEEAERLAIASPQSVIAHIQNASTKETGVLFDASIDRAASTALLNLIIHRRRLKGLQGELVGCSAPELAEAAETSTDAMAITPGRTDDGSNSIAFGDKWNLKLFHRVESGINPDVEIGQFFGGQSPVFPYAPPLLGAVEYRVSDDEVITGGVLHGYVPNAITGWQFAQDSLGRFFEHLMAQPIETRPTAAPVRGQSLLELAKGEAPALAKDLLGAFLEWAALLGRRTGELHIALASDAANPAFAPEPFTQLYQRSLYQASRKLAFQAFQQLRRQLKSLPADVQAVAGDVLEREKQVLETFRRLVGQKIEAQRIRCHGNYHLGQVLYTGKDFMIVNFDGDPTRSLSARRIKRSPFEDVAGMVRSLHYAASEALFRLPKIGAVAVDALAAWQQAADFWYVWNSSAFLRAYTAAIAPTGLVPTASAPLNLLLQVHLMEKAVYELRLELDNRSDRVAVPLQGILELSAV